MILITTILFIIPIFFVFLQKVRTLFGTIPLIALRALASRGFIGCIPLYKQTILKSKIFPRYRLIHLLKWILLKLFLFTCRLVLEPLVGWWGSDLNSIVCHMNSNEPRPDPQANLDAIASNIEARKAEVSQLKARLNELESNPSSSLLERHEAYTQWSNMDTRLVRLESDRVKIIKRISDLAFLNEELDKNQVKLADAQRTINVTQGVLDRLNTLPIYNQGPIDFTKNQQAQARIRETQAREAIAYIQTRLSER